MELSALVSMSLLLCPVELMTVAAVSDRNTVAALYTAGPLSVALQMQGKARQGSLRMVLMQQQNAYGRHQSNQT